MVKENEDSFNNLGDLSESIEQIYRFVYELRGR